MNIGVYREGGAAGGLPLPRAGIWPITMALAVIAVSALMVAPSLLLFATGGSPNVARAFAMFKEGGVLYMGFVLLLNVLVPVALTALGALVARGKRVPSTLLFLAPALPFLVGLLGAYIGQTITFGAIAGESVDPEQKIRIMAEGMAEAMANDVLSGFVTCGCALVACASACSAAATIDSTAAARGAPVARGGMAGAAIVGGLWLVVTVVISVLRFRNGGLFALLPIFAVLTILPFAILAGRGAGALRGWHDPKEASHALALMAVAGLAATLALLALERATQANITSSAFHAISGESVDPPQQARILFAAIERQQFGTVAFLIHGVFGLATFGAAMLAGFGPGGRHPMTGGGIAAIAIGLVLIGATLGLSQSRTTNANAMARVGDSVAPSNVNLPTVRQTFSIKGEGPSFGGARLVITADGSQPDKSSDTLCKSGDTKITLTVDRTLSIERLAEILAKHDCENPELVFVSKRDHDPELEAKLGDLKAYLGSVAYIHTKTTRDISTRNDILEVRSVADDAIEIEGKRITLPLPTTLETRGRPDVIRYVLRPTDTTEKMLVLIASVREALGPKATLASTFVDIGIPQKKVVLANTQGSGKAPSVRQGAAQVNGRLPTEVIQRVIRQNFGRFRLCYENGLRQNPGLSGRINSKFVIDPKGSVSSVLDAGSDLPDKAVIACVLSQFATLTFPQPEGGSVTVVFPMVFSPSN